MMSFFGLILICIVIWLSYTLGQVLGVYTVYSVTARRKGLEPNIKDFKEYAEELAEIEKGL